MTSMEQRFEVKNMKCGGCVAKVKETALATPGVLAVDVDLPAGTAWVEGDFDAQALMDALCAVGYPASLGES
jgi:copper chaperone